MEINAIKFYRGHEDVVVVEQQDFDKSIFKEQYNLALQQIEKVVSDPKDKIPSVIAFCGDRGEGKSSCMETVKNMLKMHDPNGATNRFMENRYPQIITSTFHILDTIDPAFFDEHHNVLELILGQMFSNFTKKVQEYTSDQKKQRREAIKNLHECFHDAKWCLTQMEKGLQSGYDPIEELDSLSAGMTLRDKMDKLVVEYLRFFASENPDADKSFLVISIDDLDLNVSEAYVMAEQIRKYLVSKHCILLISLKVEQLIEVIANHLNKQSAPNKSLDSPTMAAKYVTKLIPMENRVIMPKVYDLCNMKLLIYENIEDETPKVYNSIKEAVVQLIYIKTRFLFYNSKGSVSPIVPNNLRSLRHLLGLLLNMPDFEDNSESIANKHAFKAYFYQTWVRQLSEKNQQKARLLTNGSDVSDVNKLTVSILSDFIQNDKQTSNSLVSQIINPNNYSYNISVGDVFYIINFLERSNVDEELKLLLFFIKSYYGIRLYEYYDVITEQEGEMNPISKIDGEVFRSDGWFKRTNQLQRFVNGSYFTYHPDDLLPQTKVSKADFYRDLRVYSAKTQLYKETVHSLKVGMERYIERREEMDEHTLENFKHKFRVAEFLALCTKKSVKQKEPGTYYTVQRDFSEPYYLTNYHKSTGYLVFDIMAPFYNLINLKYTYGRFIYLADSQKENVDFYHFAYTHEWSLLRKMIDYVKLKECNENEQNDNNPHPINEDNMDDCFMRLISNGAIRNGDVLLAMMENITSRRANMHNMKDNVDCIKEFYSDIINSEMRTYRNSEDRQYIIRFAFLNALIELLNNEQESRLFRGIYESGIEKIEYTIDEIYMAFREFFDSIKTNKKGKNIIEEMHKLYPVEASRLSNELWNKIFPSTKLFKKENIAKELSTFMPEMVGIELKDEEDIED